MDERLIAGAPAPDEREPEATLRPKALAEFTGQPKLRETLGVFLTAARRRNEPLDHVLLFGPPNRAFGQTGAVAVQLVDHALHAVVGLGDPRRGEGVGLDDIRARLGVSVVDVLDGPGLGEDQQVIVALLVAGAAYETIAPEMVLLKAQPLDLGAHRTIEDKDALARSLPQRRKGLGTVRPGRHRPEKFIDGGHMRRFPFRLRHQKGTSHITTSLCQHTTSL